MIDKEMWQKCCQMGSVMASQLHLTEAILHYTHQVLPGRTEHLWRSVWVLQKEPCVAQSFQSVQSENFIMPYGQQCRWGHWKLSGQNEWKYQRAEEIVIVWSQIICTLYVIVFRYLCYNYQLLNTNCSLPECFWPHSSTAFQAAVQSCRIHTQVQTLPALIAALFSHFIFSIYQK